MARRFRTGLTMILNPADPSGWRWQRRGAAGRVVQSTKSGHYASFSEIAAIGTGQSMLKQGFCQDSRQRCSAWPPGQRRAYRGELDALAAALREAGRIEQAFDQPCLRIDGLVIHKRIDFRRCRWQADEVQ